MKRYCEIKSAKKNRDYKREHEGERGYMEVDRITKCELKAVKCFLKRINLIKGQRFKLWKKTKEMEEEKI